MMEDDANADQRNFNRNIHEGAMDAFNSLLDVQKGNRLSHITFFQRGK